MKHIRLLFGITFLLTHAVLAQDSARAIKPRGLGEGLQFDINDGEYSFKISGVLQPTIQYKKEDKLKSQQSFKTKRTYLNLSGSAVKEKISFFIQADFSAPIPLLDAWGAYHFSQSWSLYAGQRRTFTNNRELTFDEDKLQFADRSILSQTFQGNGREFGLFVEGSIGKSFIVAPQFALTSGDGPNSFGANSLDVDKGGVKVGGRIDVYPLGDFSVGNQGFAADLKHESTIKVLLGAAGSFNRGASNAKGEGHGNFSLYDATKNEKLPDLRKLSADILLKYQGFSFLAEYMNSSASNLNGIYVDSSGLSNSILKPGQISQYLILGNAWNTQIGYVTKSGYALDIRYENLRPEFSGQSLSVLQESKVSTVGISKYFKDNKLKVQASGSKVTFTNSKDTILAELMFQVVL
jgi:hypothetical protein